MQSDSISDGSIGRRMCTSLRRPSMRIPRLACSNRNTAPEDQVFWDLWIVRLAADGRCAAFEEWPFWPPGTRGGYDPGPAS